MSGSHRGDSWEQPERTIKEATDTIANTTGTAVATGRGTGRTGITDHLALSFFHSRAVLSKRRVVPLPRCWFCTRNRRRAHARDPSCHNKM